MHPSPEGPWAIAMGTFSLEYVIVYIIRATHDIAIFALCDPGFVRIWQIEATGTP